MKTIKMYLIYLIRWQLSTPVLAIVMSVMGSEVNDWIKSFIANFIGGLIFFWVDKYIFSSNKESMVNTNEDNTIL